MPNDDNSFNAEPTGLDLFGPIDATENPQIEEPTQEPEYEQVPEEEGGQQEPQGDDRYRYWQSVADKAKQQLAAYEQYAPFIQYIQHDPEALAVIQQRAMERSNVQQVQERLVPPEAPRKPEGYSRYDADNDPDSPSAQYDDAYREYQANLIEYLVKKDTFREEQAMKMREQQELEMRQKQVLAQTYQVLNSQYGLNQSEAIEFVQMFSDDKSVNMDNLVELYRLRRQSRQPNATQNSQRKWTPAPPVAQNTFQNKRIVSEQDAFDASLSAYSWKNKRL